MCQQHMGNEDEALNYFQLALDQATKINHPSRQVMLQNMGTINYNKKKYKTALKLYQQASDYFQENNLLTNLANSKYNIGLVYQKLGELDKSIAYYNESYEIQKKISDPKGHSYTCSSIGSALIDMQKFEQAEKFLTEALKIALEHNLKWNQKVTFEAMAKYWEKRGDFQKATEYLKEVIILTSELDQEVNKEKLSEMEAKYKTKIYKKQSRKLDVENKAMSEQIETLKNSLVEQRENYENLQKEFQISTTKINQQDDLLSSQSRMAVMGEMLSLISHQWRQPLNTIGVMVQSFQDAWSFDELNDEFINQQVEIVMDQIMYMSDTINDFQDFFKLKIADNFNLKDSILKSIKLLDFAFQKGRIKLITDFKCECPVMGVHNDIVQV
ncbi:MAG: tetratricopeptide repeat protein, partial [Candidatus Stygibacter australis]|nr:tetratricopeptide repeat protein [Candidatus Stygibacter australis]